MLWHFPIRFRGFPCDSAASHTQAASHTVSRFPHTTTRLTHFPIRFSRSPQAGHLPIRFPRIHHTIRKLQGIRPQIQRDQRPAPQIPNQSCPTDPLDLRHISANPAPTKSRKSYRPAAGGGAGTYARTAMGMYAHICTMVILARPCARLHGHGHIPSPRSSRFRARFRRDQRGRFTRIHTNQLTQIPTSNDWGAWASGYGVASRCDDDGVAATTVGSAPACMIGPEGPIMVRPEGRTGSRAIGPDGPITVKPKGQPA